MSVNPFSDDSSSPWSTSPTAQVQNEPTIESTLEKERLIKDIVSLRDGLRGLMVKVTEVESENERLRKDNEMLGVYIDNL
jgi:hypothetical protein